MKKTAALLALPILCGFSIEAHSLDGITLELGKGKGVAMERIGLTWEWQKQWAIHKAWRAEGYWEASLGNWKAENETDINPTLTDLGLTPVFRLRPDNEASSYPYFEGAIGAHLISRTSIGSTRKFGTSFQFGDHAGVGWRHGRYSFAYRFQHLSNADIKQPNQGINFSQLRFEYHF